MLTDGLSGVLANRRRLLQRGAGVAAAAAAVTSLTIPARAQGEGQSRLNQVLDRGKLIVGTGATNPPWHFEDDNGQTIGMDIDMAKILAAGLPDVLAQRLAIGR